MSQSSNKVVLITGGSRGLGKSMALHLAKHGFDIVLTYHSEEAAAHEVVKQIEAQGRTAAALRLDVGQASSFAIFAQQVTELLRARFAERPLYALINNAGTGIHQSVVDTSEAQLDEMFRVHLKSAFLLTQRLLSSISDGGRILNVSTGLARFTLPGYAAYAAMKGGVEVLTRYMAKELGPRGITVNVVAPGAIETDFGGGVVRDNPELNRAIAAQIALGRVGLPDDVGGAVALLLSEEAGWINGQRIEVSGGTML